MYRSRGKVALAAVLALGALLVAACGGSDTNSSSQSSNALSDEGQPAVAIGTKDLTEEVILGELYASALRAEGYAAP